jgi:hypothetical protein
VGAVQIFRPVKDDMLGRLAADRRMAAAFLYQTPAGPDDFALGWEAAPVHFLLTGTRDAGEWPLNFLGGLTEGKGRALYVAGEKLPCGTGFTSREVSEVAWALAALTGEEFLARYDPARMNALGVAPADWQEEDERLEAVVDAFAHVREALARAAAKRVGLVFYAAAS